MNGSVDNIINYSIYKYSSFTPPHVPENILEDKPDDQSSRWSSETNDPPQFLTLKLDNPAIVKEITFGKYRKHHICDLKKFSIYGGMNEENLTELLNSGLKSDNLPENFAIKYSINCHQFPCRYIKILPIQSWGPGYNFSIWHVKLKGNDDPNAVKEALVKFNAYRETLAIRLCLKHFRQHRLMEAFEALQKKTQVTLEHPFLSKLHNLLVVKGDFKGSESFIADSMKKGLLNEYLNRQNYHPKWTPIIPSPDNPKPGMRSGHQMCIDPFTEIIFLFGGWDGTKDLADLWCFNIQTNVWTCLSQDTSLDGGPSARSCHRMCLDYTRKKLFLLGRYPKNDQTTRNYSNSTSLKSDFYVFDTESNKWTLITKNTFSMGGPCLLQHHQMVIDIEKNTIYVFGGKVVSQSVDDDRICDRERVCGIRGDKKYDKEELSGLYSYHVPTNTWTVLREDISHPNDVLKIPSRAGHSMLFHSKTRLIYIFGGRRGKETVQDMITYDVDSDQINYLRGDNQEMPASEYTHTATIDPEFDEIHVLYGINRERERRLEALKNSLWVYRIKDMKWTCISHTEEAIQSSVINHSKPCPRYAMQLVYDQLHKVHYLFGGNSGRRHLPKARLDDFWSLRLCKLGSCDLLMNCQKLIRELCFREKITENPVEAVRFLQNELSKAFDHSDAAERKKLEQLATSLFKDQEKDYEYYPKFEESKKYSIRTQVFDSLVKFFPDYMTQPKEDLINLIQF